MHSPSLRAALIVGSVVAVNWLILAAIEPDGGSGKEYVALGNLIGSMFAQATLAGAWSAWGPGWLIVRLPLSFGWLVSLSLALMINIGLHGGPPDAVFVLSACMISQWLLVQIPLWLIALGFGIRLRYAPQWPGEWQFGIRQLMILTAIVAVVLGVARTVFLQLAARFGERNAEPAIFIFLATAGVLMILPLLVAALLPRAALPASLVVLLLIALATSQEIPLLNKLLNENAGGGPNFYHFAWINGFQAFWVLAIVGAVRWCGYGLAPRTNFSIGSPQPVLAGDV
jgi:hypothetical protein